MKKTRACITVFPMQTLMHPLNMAWSHQGGDSSPASARRRPYRSFGWGRLASVRLTVYQSAKWAVGGFSLDVSQELAPFGVKVTILEPGGMRTDWAGASMTIPLISAPYRQTVGASADSPYGMMRHCNSS